MVVCVLCFFSDFVGVFSETSPHDTNDCMNDEADLDLDEPVTQLKHIGPGVAARLLALFGATTLGEFNALVDERVAIPNVRRRTRQLQAMMDGITRNARAGECWEGYMVRKFNANARRRIAEYLLARPPAHGGPVAPAIVRAALPMYDSTRDPRVPCAPGADPAWDHTFYLQAVSGPNPREGGWPFPHTGGNREALTRAAPAARPTGRYPYSRDDYTLANALRAAQNVAERDAVLNANPDHPRKQWPCPCFREEATCLDMSAARGHRQGRVPPCAWDADAGLCRVDGDAVQRPRRAAAYAGNYRDMHVGR